VTPPTSHDAVDEKSEGFGKRGSGGDVVSRWSDAAAAIVGDSRAGLFRTNRRFARQAYVVIERFPGQTLYSRIEQLPTELRGNEGLVQKIACSWPICIARKVIHHDIKRAAFCFAPQAKCPDRFRIVASQSVADLLQEEIRLPYGTAP